MISCGNQHKHPLLNYVNVHNNWNGYIGCALNSIVFNYSPLKTDRLFQLNYEELSDSRKPRSIMADCRDEQ